MFVLAFVALNRKRLGVKTDMLSALVILMHGFIWPFSWFITIRNLRGDRSWAGICKLVQNKLGYLD
jgi:hypothetical protein